jgi:hypothetical protein
MNRAVELLNEVNRRDLSRLLQFSSFSFSQEEVSDVFFDQIVPITTVISPPAFSEALEGLVDWEKKRIGEAIARAFPDNRVDPDRLSFVPDNTIEIGEHDALFAEVIIHRNQMISVATQRERIQDVDDYYRARHARLTRNLFVIGIEHPNPHEDLWDWYHKWKNEFPTYKERREYVNALYSEVIRRLTTDAVVTAVVPREPTGWERVDRTLTKAHHNLEVALHSEDFQAIGLLCREVLISLGEAVYDPTVHQTVDGVEPSSTDAGRMIEAFLINETRGPSNENLRRHAKAALKLAVELQHRRTAEFRVCALCLEATASVVNIVTILSGRRDKS